MISLAFLCRRKGVLARCFLYYYCITVVFFFFRLAQTSRIFVYILEDMNLISAFLLTIKLSYIYIIFSSYTLKSDFLI